MSVADARVREAAGATLTFAVTLNRASPATVTVNHATSDATATAGADYEAKSGTLTFSPGDTSKSVVVNVLDDAHDEGEETLTLTPVERVGRSPDGRPGHRDDHPPARRIRWRVSGRRWRPRFNDRHRDDPDAGTRRRRLADGHCARTDGRGWADEQPQPA